MESKGFTIANVGAQEMYSQGFLASVDVTKLAEAHASVFKAMNNEASGRYICFDHVIDTHSEAEKLAKDIGMPEEKICGDVDVYDDYTNMK